jgi:hypothetical protein
MKSIGILSHLVKTDIVGKRKNTFLLETGIGGNGKGYFWWKRVTPIHMRPLQRRSPTVSLHDRSNIKNDCVENTTILKYILFIYC